MSLSHAERDWALIHSTGRKVPHKPLKAGLSWGDGVKKIKGLKVGRGGDGVRQSRLKLLSFSADLAICPYSCPCSRESSPISLPGSWTGRHPERRRPMPYVATVRFRYLVNT